MFSLVPLKAPVSMNRPVTTTSATSFSPAAGGLAAGLGAARALEATRHAQLEAAVSSHLRRIIISSPARRLSPASPFALEAGRGQSRQTGRARLRGPALYIGRDFAAKLSQT